MITRVYKVANLAVQLVHELYFDTPHYHHTKQFGENRNRNHASNFGSDYCVRIEPRKLFKLPKKAYTVSS